MGPERRRWWNSFAIEQSFKQRQLLRVFGFTAVYVAISTVAVSVFYSQLVAPLADSGLPLSAHRPPGLGQAVTVWATLMMGLSAFFATATGLYFGHKLAGPIYRFKTELRRIADGKPVRRIKLREGDEFHDVADALNAALERVELAESALVDRLKDEQAAEVIREAHASLVQGLEEIDLQALEDADRDRFEAWRDRLRALQPKLESAG